MLDKQILLYALLIVFLASLLEAAICSRGPAGYDWRSFGVSMVNWTMRTLIGRLLPISVATPVFVFAWDHRIATIPLSGWTSIVLLFFGQELCYYWFHRSSHRVRWFWAHHSVHHTPNDLTLAAALRSGVFGRLIGVPLFFAPLVWLGFPPSVVLATLSLNLLYQFWIHATWIPNLGWLELVLNTPSAHRVHHAANTEYLDSNYGGVLIVFDRLFGTYRKEDASIPIRYGLVKPQTSYNPLRIEVGQWLSLFHDMVRSRSLRTAAMLAVMPPGWRPGGQGETTEDLRRAARAHLPGQSP